MTTPQRRLVEFDPDKRVAAREAVERYGRYELAVRHVYLAAILAAGGIVAALYFFLRNALG